MMPTGKIRVVLIKWLPSSPQLGAERFVYIGQLVFMYELLDMGLTREIVLRIRNRLSVFRQRFPDMERRSEWWH